MGTVVALSTGSAGGTVSGGTVSGGTVSTGTVSGGNVSVGTVVSTGGIVVVVTMTQLKSGYRTISRSGCGSNSQNTNATTNTTIATIVGVRGLRKYCLT